MEWLICLELPVGGWRYSQDVSHKQGKPLEALEAMFLYIFLMLFEHFLKHQQGQT